MLGQSTFRQTNINKQTLLNTDKSGGGGKEHTYPINAYSPPPQIQAFIRAGLKYKQLSHNITEQVLEDFYINTETNSR